MMIFKSSLAASLITVFLQNKPFANARIGDNYPSFKNTALGNQVVTRILPPGGNGGGQGQGNANKPHPHSTPSPTSAPTDSPTSGPTSSPTFPAIVGDLPQAAVFWYQCPGTTCSVTGYDESQDCFVGDNSCPNECGSENGVSCTWPPDYCWDETTDTCTVTTDCALCPNGICYGFTSYQCGRRVCKAGNLPDAEACDFESDCRLETCPAGQTCVAQDLDCGYAI